MPLTRIVDCLSAVRRAMFIVQSLRLFKVDWRALAMRQGSYSHRGFSPVSGHGIKPKAVNRFSVLSQRHHAALKRRRE